MWWCLIKARLMRHWCHVISSESACYFNLFISKIRLHLWFQRPTTPLESKITELEQAKATISQQTQTEFSTQEKATQTDLTMEQIKQ